MLYNSFVRSSSRELVMVSSATSIIGAIREAIIRTPAAEKPLQQKQKATTPTDTTEGKAAAAAATLSSSSTTITAETTATKANNNSTNTNSYNKNRSIIIIINNSSNLLSPLRSICDLNALVNFAFRQSPSTQRKWFDLK